MQISSIHNELVALDQTLIIVSKGEVKFQGKRLKIGSGFKVKTIIKIQSYYYIKDLIFFSMLVFTGVQTIVIKLC
jgi:hypothetical protein